MRIITTGLCAVLVAGLLAACGAEDDSDRSSDSAKRPPGTRTCGNGRIDTGEQCDGRNLNGQTCATVTMGAKPRGSLSCSKSCTFNTKRCTGSGAGGTGGSGGAAGSGGASAGTGGV